MGVHDWFPETSWTLLARAREPCDEGARAREEFAARYYRPVREFLCVQDHDRAQDLAQEFFVKLSAPRGLFDLARPDKGGFRHYLLRALRNQVIDYHRRVRPEVLQTHPDQAGDGGWDTLELPGFPAAEAAFHLAWVKVKLAEALAGVQALCLARNQEAHLDLFRARYLSESNPAPSWEELGARYGLDQKTARDRAGTVARHFRLVLRRMLRDEIAAPGAAALPRAPTNEAAVDAEIKALLSPLQD